MPAPAQLPPPGSGPLVYVLGLCFSAQGNQSAVEPETYLYYLRLRPSRPSQREWVAFDDSTRETIKEDFRRLWATGFLDDLKIEATDYTFANGVVGKIVTYHLEERARVRLVKYEGAGDLEQTKIDESLREHGAEIKLDAFLDQGVIRRARTVLRDLLAEKGFAAAEVSSAIEPIAGSAKLVSLVFNVTRGPKLVIRDVAFIGNRAVPDSDLGKVLKNNRPQGLLSLVTSRGAYNETTFADDAQRVEDYYRNQGYVAVRVGQPEVRTLDDSADGKTRFVQLRIPVYEGRRYRVGTIGFEGQTIVRAEALQSIFKLKPGAWYRQESIRDGLNKAREIYGSIGHMEFTGYPDLKRRDVPAEGEGGTTPPPEPDDGGGWPGDRRRRDAAVGRAALRHQPDRLQGQHDHARRRDPPRAEPVRGRRLQHRGAQAQRPPPESARLLQAARRLRQGPEGRQGERRRGRGRPDLHARGAEPQPAAVRRRRVAVPTAPSSTCPTRPPT